MIFDHLCLYPENHLSVALLFSQEKVILVGFYRIMTTLLQAESKLLYSWWLDNHSSPRNSRWLHDNLTDMNNNVKSMIKLMEEDGDSFARRAEMYYKKRPELMQLVEEFYRTYRALAERYDHATGSLRLAHRTMAEVLPGQHHLAHPDDTPTTSPFTEEWPYTPRMSPPIRTLFDADDCPKDATCHLSHFHAVNRNGAYLEENFASPSKKGLKQVNEFFDTEDKATFSKLGEGRIKRGLCVLEKKVSGSEFEMHNGSKEFEKQDGDEVFHEKLKMLQSELSLLFTENENLKMQLNLKEENLSKTQDELQNLRDFLAVSQAEKENICFQYQQSFNKIVDLELEIDSLRKLLTGERLNDSNADNAEKTLYFQYQEELNDLMMDDQSKDLMLNDMKLTNQHLEEKVYSLKEELENMSEQNISSQRIVRKLQEEVLGFRKTVGRHEAEFGSCVDAKKALEQEIYSLTEKIYDLQQKNLYVTEKLQAAVLDVMPVQALVKELQEENLKQKETCMKQEEERSYLLQMIENAEKIFEKNAALEDSLSDANAELHELREKIIRIEDFCESLCGTNSTLMSENRNLTSEIETLTENMDNILKNNSALESCLCHANGELDELRGSIKKFKQSFQSLSEEKSSLLSENNGLLSKVESIGYTLENLRKKCEELQYKTSHLELEKDLTLTEVSELQNTLNEETQSANIEIFILERCLGDLKKLYSNLRRNSNKLKDEFFNQQKVISFLSEEKERLSEKLSELQNSVFEGEEENYKMKNEKSVYLNLLGQYGCDLANLNIESCTLDQECRIITEELQILQMEKENILQIDKQLRRDLVAGCQREKLLEEEMQNMHKQLSDLQVASADSQNDYCVFLKDHCDILQKSFSLECFSLVLEHSNAKHAAELKFEYSNSKSLHISIDELENNVKQMAEKMKIVEAENLQLKDRTLKLEEDNGMIRSSNERLTQIKKSNQRINMENKLLIQREVKLSEAHQSLLTIQNESTEMGDVFLADCMELEREKAAREESKKEALELTENTSKLEEIKFITEANTLLDMKLQRFHDKNEDPKAKEQQFSSELLNEVRCYEEEILHLFTDAQIASILAITFEDKVNELLKLQSLEINICDDIFAKFMSLEENLMIIKENGRGMGAQLDDYLAIASSFYSGNTLQSISDHKEQKAGPLTRVQHGMDDHEEQSRSPEAPPQKIFLLHTFLTKLEGLRQVLMDSEVDVDTKEEASRMEKSRYSRLNPAEGQSGDKHVKDDIMQDSCTKISNESCKMAVKDIQLDCVSNPPRNIIAHNLYKKSMDNIDDTDDQMLEIWETAEGVDNMKSQRISLLVDEDALEYRCTESLAKQSTVDKLEAPNKCRDSLRSWNKITRKLSSNSQRLIVLQTSIHELKKIMLNFEEGSNPKCLEFESIKAQLKEFEKAVLKLINVNKKLQKNLERCSESFDCNTEEPEETLRRQKKRVAEHARRVSEAIGRLQLELQKMRYVLLKVEEEFETRRKKAEDKRSRVVLRDYIYGKQESKSKKGNIFGCMNSKTVADSLV